MLMEFIKARSLSVTMTLGKPSHVINNSFSLWRPQMKLLCRSLDKNTKAAEKVRPVNVTPTISRRGSLYLLVL